MDHLLEDIGELPTPAHRTKDWAGRTRERTDAGLLLLQDLGVFGNLAWLDGYRPGDPDRSKGWVEGWLASRIQMTLAGISPTPALPAAPSPPNAAPHRRLRHATRTTGPTVDGATLRQARQERGWSQAALAHALGISRTYLSQIEMGQRAPSAKLTRQCLAWLQRRS
jgi:DNA-binding XRE family transcriptional regulator